MSHILSISNCNWPIFIGQDIENIDLVVDDSEMSVSQNISEGPAGYTVRFVRNGIESSQYFRFTDGGKRAALRRARTFRDKQLKRLGPRKWKQGPRKKPSNNTSGITGVSKNFYGRWVTTWQQEGKQRFKTFGTRKEAIAHRKKMLKLN